VAQLMEGDFEVDLQEVIDCVKTAEVMSIFIPTLRKAVVIDTRSSEAEGPLVRIMPLVASPQERVRSLRRLRPGFPSVRDLTVIPWPRYVNSLVTLGIWDRIIKRFVDSGYQEAATACVAVLEELRRLEKEELAEVVRGQDYHTLWSSSD
jgi:hypothetical protein